MPQDRADFLSGQICAVLANIHRAEDSPIFDAHQFIPALAVEVEEEVEVAEVDLHAMSEQIKGIFRKET